MKQAKKINQASPKSNVKERICRYWLVWHQVFDFEPVWQVLFQFFSANYLFFLHTMTWYEFHYFFEVESFSKYYLLWSFYLDLSRFLIDLWYISRYIGCSDVGIIWIIYVWDGLKWCLHIRVMNRWRFRFQNGWTWIPKIQKDRVEVRIRHYDCYLGWFDNAAMFSPCLVEGCRVWQCRCEDRGRGRFVRIRCSSRDSFTRVGRRRSIIKESSREGWRCRWGGGAVGRWGSFAWWVSVSG